MPKAKIVYNGAGGGGDLFEGKKFYLMQRIPAREKFKELITVCSLDVRRRIRSWWYSFSQMEGNLLLSKDRQIW